MTKPFSLQTVLDLMQIRTDDATRHLAQLIASERDAKAKLEMLQHYRDEYATRFRESAQNGLSQREWQNFQHFLNRLDEAIDVQRKLFSKRATVTLPDGSQHIFDYGAMNIDKCVAAIEAR